MSKKQSVDEPGINDMVYFRIPNQSIIVSCMIEDIILDKDGEKIYVLRDCHSKAIYPSYSFFPSYEAIVGVLRNSTKNQ